MPSATAISTAKTNKDPLGEILILRLTLYDSRGSRRLGSILIATRL
jgi:hypothetical protein